MTHAPTRLARRRLLGAAAALACLGPRALAAAGDALHVLCSGPAGSIPDVVARSVGEQWFATTGQRAVIDNKPGAAGQIAVAALKAGAADGSTLLLAQGAIATVYPSLYAKLAYDPTLDLQPVSLAGEMPLALAIGPAVPGDVTTLDGFIAWLRRNPAAANLGSPGTGTLPHLLEAMLMREEGIAWQHVAYAGGPPAMNDLLGGQIAALALPEGLLRQHHATRRARVLATSGPARSTYLPDVPSFVELGHPTLVIKEWFAFFASARVPKDAIESRSAALREAIARPELAAVFAQAGMTPASSTPSQLAARIATEQRHWPPILRANGIHAD